MEPVDRPAARVLLLTPDSEVLLMQLEVRPEWRVWVAPGGGLEAGEAPEEGAVRELLEETGRRIRPGPAVWTRTNTFELHGRRVRQRETFFLARVERFEPRTGGLEEAERSWFRGFRWWTIEAIRRSEERFAPRRLGRLLDELAERGPPPTPIDVGV